jgi:hypothetical protein
MRSAAIAVAVSQAESELMANSREENRPRPVVLGAADAVFDAGTRAVAGLQEGQLPDTGVGGERLVAPAVAFFEDGELGTGVGAFTAHYGPHPRRPPRKIQQPGDLCDVAAGAHAAIGVEGGRVHTLSRTRVMASRTLSVTG